MQLSKYIETVLTNARDAAEALNKKGVTVSPALHEDIRKTGQLPYGNSGKVLTEFEITVTLTSDGEVEGKVSGVLASLKSKLSSKRQHKVKIKIWAEI